MDDRTHLTSAASAAAGKIAAALDENPVRGKGSYPLTDVLTTLDEQFAVIQQAIAEYPHALSVDPSGNADKMGTELAGLMGYLQHILVLYHNLDDLPDRLRAQAHRDLSAAHLRARRVRGLK